MSQQPWIASGYGHCPVCGQQLTTAGFTCGHSPFTDPKPGSDSAPIQYAIQYGISDPRDAEIARLREALEIIKRIRLLMRENTLYCREQLPDLWIELDANLASEPPAGETL